MSVLFCFLFIDLKEREKGREDGKEGRMKQEREREKSTLVERETSIECLHMCFAQESNSQSFWCME